MAKLKQLFTIPSTKFRNTKLI